MINSTEEEVVYVKEIIRREILMPEQKKQFPTPAMLKAQEEWEKKTPQEREAIENAFKEELRKYYEGRLPRDIIMDSIDSMEEKQRE